MGGLGVKVQHFPLTLLDVLTTLTLPCERDVIWNAIPLSVRDAPSVSTFKRRLKSFYFNSLLSKS